MRVCMGCGKYFIDTTGNVQSQVCWECQINNIRYTNIQFEKCDHDFRPYEGEYISSGGLRKYQCRKCLEIRWAE